MTADPPDPPPCPSDNADESTAWSRLVALAALQRQVPQSLALCKEALWIEGVQFINKQSWSPSAATLLDLYGPLVLSAPGEPYVIGHLGQSLDAFIATASGHSCYVTGPTNLKHLHRLRALSDAIVVGAGTAASDDPQLTTRLVPGPHPVRVVVDPEGRVDRALRLFQDGEAPTLTVVSTHCPANGLPAEHTLRVPVVDGALSLPALQTALAQRGLRRLFVEGGGVTVSRWMIAGLLDRLHLACAPVLIGAGRPALQLPAVPTMNEALRPACRAFRMGRDVMWDIELPRCSPLTSDSVGSVTGNAGDSAAGDTAPDPELQRIY